MKKLIIILGVLSVSASAIFVRSSTAPSMVLVLYRCLMASLILLPVVLLKFRGELFHLPKKALLLSALSGVFLGIHFTVYFESLKYTSIASSVVLVDSEVLFVALAMMFLFREKITRKGWIGIGITLLGSAIIGLADAGGGSNLLLGDFLALTGALFMAVYTMIGKVCRNNLSLSTTVYTFVVYLSSALTVLALLLIQGTPLFGYAGNNYLIALGMAVFCTLLGHSVFSWGLKYEKASFVSTAKLLEPIFASAWGFAIFAEVPGPYVAAGGCLALLGIVFYSRNCD